MINSRYFNFVFIGIMAVAMGGVMSFFMLFLETGWTNDFLSAWGNAFVKGTIVAAPTSFIVGPQAKKIAMFIANK